jgi:hypothetical protein
VNVLREVLAEVNNQTAEIEAKLVDLHAERRGLELALARLAGTAEYGERTTQSQRITSEPVAIPYQPTESIPRPEEWRMLGKTEPLNACWQRRRSP